MDASNKGSGKVTEHLLITPTVDPQDLSNDLRLPGAESRRVVRDRSSVLGSAGEGYDRGAHQADYAVNLVDDAMVDEQTTGGVAGSSATQGPPMRPRSKADGPRVFVAPEPVSAPEPVPPWRQAATTGCERRPPWRTRWPPPPCRCPGPTPRPA